MSDDEYTCPHCQADLRAKAIPPEQQASFGNKPYFSRLMVINDYGTSYNCCPDCKVVWDIYSGAIKGRTEISNENV